MAAAPPPRRLPRRLALRAARPHQERREGSPQAPPRPRRHRGPHVTTAALRRGGAGRLPRGCHRAARPEVSPAGAPRRRRPASCDVGGVGVLR